MQNNAWYLLKTHHDFSVPTGFDLLTPMLCDFAVQEADGTIKINPMILDKNKESRFFEVASQEDAEFILFPFEAKEYIETGNSHIFIDMIRSIKKYPKNGQKLIVCDSADNTEILSLDFIQSKICYFKVNLLKEYRDRAYPFSYTISDHIAHEVSNWNYYDIKYDVSFIGNLTNPIRKFVSLSVQRENALHSKVSFDKKIFFEEKNDIIYVKRKDRNYLDDEKRQSLFRKITQQSLCILCPPGFGPQTIRFYETLFYGRIPVVFDVGVVYPFEDILDYHSFTLTISKEDIHRTGAIILEFIRSTPKDELYERCIASKKAFYNWFRSEIRLQKFCDVYLKKE